MIMIVDDNTLIRTMIRQYVGRFAGEQEIVECCDGGEAVDAYQRLIPDWVLMDIKMRDIDGLTATKHIRQQFPGARIIIVSDFDDPDFREAASRNGAAGYVLKDRLFELQELMQ